MNRHVFMFAICFWAPASLFAQDARKALGDTLQFAVRESRTEFSPNGAAFVMQVATVRQYGCLGFNIKHDYVRRGDTLAFRLTGVEAMPNVCAAAMGPAILSKSLHLASGRYTVDIERDAAHDYFGLSITDSTFAVVPRSATSIVADSRTWWRRPLRSIAFSCGNERQALCDDVRRWFGGREDVKEISFGSSGVNPYAHTSLDSVSSPTTTYLVTHDSTMSAIRRCFAEIQTKIRDAVGVSLQVQFWNGSGIWIWSNKSYSEPHIAAPPQVTEGAECSKSE